jgi:hypothetical protein
MVPLVLLGRSAVVQRSLGAEYLLFSTLLIRVVRVALVECDNFVTLGITRLSTKVRTTCY